MDGCRFIKEIKENKIDFSTIEAINPGAYKDYVDRIRSMYCIDTIIKNCELNILRKSNVVSLDALYSRGEVDTPVRIRVAW